MSQILLYGLPSFLVLSFAFILLSEVRVPPLSAWATPRRTTTASSPCTHAGVPEAPAPQSAPPLSPPQVVKEPYTWSVGGAVIDNGSEIVSLLVPTLLRVLVLPLVLVGGLVWGLLNKQRVEAFLNGKANRAVNKRK